MTILQDDIVTVLDVDAGPSPAPIDTGLLFRENYTWLCRWVTRSSGDANSGEDIAAQAFVELLKMETVSHPRALLKTIARRLLCDRARRARVEKRYLAELGARPEVYSGSAEDSLIVRDSLRMVQLVLADLSPNTRAAFLYSQIDGLSYAEIGRRLGVSTSRVQQYMARAFRNCAKVAEL